MGRPQRNGECGKCSGKLRHYPGPDGGPGAWAHLERADWIDDPHDPDPTEASLEAAGLTG